MEADTRKVNYKAYMDGWKAGATGSFAEYPEDILTRNFYESGFDAGYKARRAAKGEASRISEHEPRLLYLQESDLKGEACELGVSVCEIQHIPDRCPNCNSISERFGNLSHNPGFKLPCHFINPPKNLEEIVELHFSEIHLITLSRMLHYRKGGGEYKPIAAIRVQDHEVLTHPLLTPDSLSDYIMMCTQHSVDKEGFGTFRANIIGPPGKGSFRRTRHFTIDSVQTNSYQETKNDWWRPSEELGKIECRVCHKKADMVGYFDCSGKDTVGM